MRGKRQRGAPVPRVGGRARGTAPVWRAAGALVLLSVLAPAQARAQARQQRMIQQYGQEIKRRSATLDSIKAELQRGRARLDELREREQSSLALLRQLERTIALAERYQEALSAGIDTLTRRIDSLDRALTAERGNLRMRQEAMQRRLVSMYKAGALGPAGVLLELASPVEFLRRRIYFQRLKAYDDHLIRAIADSKARIERDKSDVEHSRAEQQALLAEKQAEQRRLVAGKASREAMLREIQAEKDEYMARMAELEASQKQLLVLIRQLESRKAAAAEEYERSLSSKFEKRKGRLDWPVEGQVVGTFGKVVHPVYKTVTMSNGIDIAARPGAAVRCVAAGSVAYIGRMRGLGRFLVVDHYAGYLTIYGNLGAISVALEDKVDYGTVVGHAGAAGAPEGSTVHFEVRKSTDALDPLQWLSPREGQ